VASARREVAVKHAAIVFSSKYGQTAKVAGYLRHKLLDLKIESELFNLGTEKGRHDPVRLEHFDLVVIGSPVYTGKLAKPVLAWAAANLDMLLNLPTALFTVGLRAADRRPEGRIAEREALNSFVASTRLAPRITTSFSGAVKYRRYGWLKRALMKSICKDAGLPTDTSRDHELTDWARVDEFVEGVLSLTMGERRAVLL
jgi:menaquinone-dependent protoporphyrinogen oxidase